MLYTYRIQELSNQVDGRARHCLSDLHLLRVRKHGGLKIQAIQFLPCERVSAIVKAHRKGISRFTGFQKLRGFCSEKSR